MNTIETLYLWTAAQCLLAYIAGFSSGWTTLRILQKWRRQSQRDRAEAADHQEPQFVPLSENDRLVFNQNGKSEP